LLREEDLLGSLFEEDPKQRAPEGCVAIGTPVKIYPTGDVWGIVCDSFVGGEDADGQEIIFYTIRWTVSGPADIMVTSNEPEYNLIYPFGLNRKIMNHLGGIVE